MQAEPDPSHPDLTTTLFLVHRAKEGEQEALGELLQRYYSRVRKIVQLRLGGQLLRQLEVGDILQETFIAAIKAFDQFELRNHASVINWLSRIAERKILLAAQHLSAEKRDPSKQVSLEEVSEEEAAIEIPDEHRGPESSVSEREEAEIVEQCIAELPEAYREIIVLRDYVGFPWEDVAREHGRPSVSAARVMHGKAMVKLNRLLRSRLR